MHPEETINVLWLLAITAFIGIPDSEFIEGLTCAIREKNVEKKKTEKRKELPVFPLF